MMVFYVYISFNVLPLIGFRDDFAIEDSCGVGHLELFIISLSCCYLLLYDLVPVFQMEVDGTGGDIYVMALPAT